MEVGQFYKVYVSSFFANATSYQPKTRPFHPYHVQKNIPVGRNPVLDRLPMVEKFMTAMPVDFFAKRKSGDTGCEKLHDKEEKLRESGSKNDMEINKEVLFSTLKKVFSNPRHWKIDAENRDAIGSYIYGRMGRMGLITYMQTFQATRPMFGNMNKVMMI